ncbi:hypothetical protein ABZ319_34655 [Nocardia sp. NPDC005978]|uniref:hypothetical protein n=1 Tax=Nocardia sp. NPDC005978 TaxID=3156725 RepID=UPI0033A65AF7
MGTDQPTVNPVAATGFVLGLLSVVTAVPAAAMLLTFGERPDPAPVVSDTVLISDPSGSAAPCVMFCDPTPLTIPAIPPPATSEPGCRFLCEEPPLPSGTELCRLFCEIGQVER